MREDEPVETARLQHRADTGREHRDRRHDHERPQDPQQDVRRTLVDVVRLPRVVPGEAVARARELQGDERDQQHAEEDVPRDQPLHPQDRQTFDEEQHEDDGTDRRRDARVPVDVRRGRLRRLRSRRSRHLDIVQRSSGLSGSRAAIFTSALPGVIRPRSRGEHRCRCARSCVVRGPSSDEIRPEPPRRGVMTGPGWEFPTDVREAVVDARVRPTPGRARRGGRDHPRRVLARVEVVRAEGVGPALVDGIGVGVAHDAHAHDRLGEGRTRRHEGIDHQRHPDRGAARGPALRRQRHPRSARDRQAGPRLRGNVRGVGPSRGDGGGPRCPDRPHDRSDDLTARGRDARAAQRALRPGGQLVVHRDEVHRHRARDPRERRGDDHAAGGAHAGARRSRVVDRGVPDIGEAHGAEAADHHDQAPRARPRPTTSTVRPRIKAKPKATKK